MKQQWFKRILGAAVVSAMLVSMCTACGGSSEKDDGTLPNGNVRTAVEVGSEKELTAVREGLIKATEIKGLDEITAVELYENGVRVASDEMIQARDNKKLYHAGAVKRVVNYADGYMLDIPNDWKPDFSMSQARSTFYTDDMTLHISDETDAINVYGSAQGVFDATFQFIGTENYREKNNIRKIFEEKSTYGDMNLYVLQVEMLECLEGTQNVYTYVMYYNERKITWMMFKCVDDTDFIDVYRTYEPILVKGSALNTVAFPEGQNDSWNEETRAYYESLKNTDKVVWGMVNGNIEKDPLKLNYRLLESQLEHKFPIVTTYTDQMQNPFPVEDALKIHNDGRTIQFTFHFDYAYGNTMGNQAPILDVYRGMLDDEFREFARGVVEYGHPMLFRMNNEMNSDWVSWAAINAMCDPDIFTATWQRIHDIFEEEGANQYLIWVWNPQGRTTGPILSWNDTFLYFPGADYVDMLGVTGYNFGNEYVWDSFEAWYQGITDYYMPYFGDWAWIIGEFGCSDSSTLEAHEGRRAVWIKEMFDCFEQNMFPNIKAAVWFNANDYDSQGNITHEISLGRDRESREAFREGLDRTQ